MQFVIFRVDSEIWLVNSEVLLCATWRRAKQWRLKTTNS